MLQEALYFFIPAYVSNMTPVFVQKINFLNIPIDFNKTYMGKRILGTNKTWRGIFFGSLMGLLIFEIQRFLFNLGYLHNFALIDYSSAPLFLGLFLGFSALLGDLIESFFKRRLNIKPGRPWIPFDQIDFLTVSILLTVPFTHIMLIDSLMLLATVFLFTIIVQYMGYKLNFKKDPL